MAARVEFSSNLPEQTVDGALQVAEEIDACILRDAIEKLPHTMKEAVLLHYFMDMPLRDVAKMLSVPTGTARRPSSRRPPHIEAALVRARLAEKISTALLRRGGYYDKLCDSCPHCAQLTKWSLTTLQARCRG